MAIQKICDRCGKPVVADKLPWLIMPYKPGDDSRYPFEDMAWDLCQVCENELIKWQSYAFVSPFLKEDEKENTNSNDIYLERLRSILPDDPLNGLGTLTEDDKRKLEELVDQGAFARTHDVSADEIREILKNDPLNGYISATNEKIFEEDRSGSGTDE